MKKGILCKLLSAVAGAAAGIAVTSVLVFGAGGIARAEFNDVGIVFNGQLLDLAQERVVSVVAEGSNYAENFIPMRRTLEQMGFTVTWDESQNTVIIN